MNKRFQTARIAVYVITIFLVTLVTAYQISLTPSMIVTSLSVAIIGAVLLLLLDKLEDCNNAVSLDARIKPDLKTLIVTTFRKKPYVSIYEGDISESEKSKNSPAQPFMLAPKPLFFMVLVNLLGTIVRVVFLPFQSSDFISQQLYWHGQFAGKGLDALSIHYQDNPCYGRLFACHDRIAHFSRSHRRKIDTQRAYHHLRCRFVQSASYTERFLLGTV